MIANKICDFIDNTRDEIIDFALDCIRQSSETPPGNETAIAELIKKKALRWGLGKPQVFAKKQERPNLIFNLNGARNGKKLILGGHLDTKPLGDANSWKVIDPLKPAIVDGRLYGRGSTDMKGALVGMLAAVYAIKSAGLSFNGELGLLFTADEEGGCAYGAKYLAEVGFGADAIVLGEPSGEERNFDTIGIASRGVLLGKIIVHGTQMHSSISDRGGCINASVKMAKVLTEFAQNLKNDLRYKPNTFYPLGPTINPGVILEGGIFYGVVPGLAGFGFDIRVIPGMEFISLKEDIESFLKKLKKDDPELDAELVLEKPPLDAWMPPAEIDEDHPIVKSCAAAAKNIMGYEPIKVGEPFATESSFYANKLNIPTISSFGPGFIKLAHSPDEYVGIDAIVDSAKIYALAALDFLK
jgi:acetylornithine deacetylase/succinyl-diaminopimelate desuccinylase family protein